MMRQGDERSRAVKLQKTFNAMTYHGTSKQAAQRPNANTQRSQGDGRDTEHNRYHHRQRPLDVVVPIVVRKDALGASWLEAEIRQVEHTPDACQRVGPANFHHKEE